MKRLLAFVFLGLLLPMVTFAQGGLIGLYVDRWGGICDIADSGIDIIDVYVIHKYTSGATASQFRVVASVGFTGVYLGEEIPLQWGACIGNSQHGIALAYAHCHTSPIHILTIRYLLNGTSAPNSYLKVVGHPDPRIPDPKLAMVDCDSNTHPVLGGIAYINNDGSADCAATPVETQTWGRIKSLYR